MIDLGGCSDFHAGLFYSCNTIDSGVVMDLKRCSDFDSGILYSDSICSGVSDGFGRI